VPRHVEIAVPVVVYVRVAGVRHHDDHGLAFARGDEFVHHVLHVSGRRPVYVRTVQSVKEIDHGIGFLRRGVVAFRQIQVVRHLFAEDGALHAVRADLALAQRLRLCLLSRRQGKGQ